MISNHQKFQTEIEPLEGEIWIPIFRNYEISNMGRVKSKCWGYDILMKTYKNNRGYHCLDFRVNGKKKKSTVHKLVASIFLKNTNTLRITVNHHFGKDDNRAESLSWMTYSENTIHGVENGLIYRGSKHYAASLDDAQVRTIKSMKGQITQAAIAKYFKVKRHVIYDIISGKSWRHI